MLLRSLGQAESLRVSAGDKRSGGETSQGDGEDTASERGKAGEGGPGSQGRALGCRQEGTGGGLVLPGTQVKSSSNDHWAKVAITPTSGVSDVGA